MACFSCEKPNMKEETISLLDENRLNRILSGIRDDPFNRHLIDTFKYENMELYMDLKKYTETKTSRGTHESARNERKKMYNNIIEKWVKNGQAYIPYDIIKRVEDGYDDENCDLFSSYIAQLSQDITTEFINFCVKFK